VSLHASEVATSIAAVSATAAAISAWFSRQEVERAHQPFVYGEPAVTADGTVIVAIHNDGVGVGRAIRTRLEPLDDSTPSAVGGRIRALRAGERFPDARPITFELDRPRSAGGYVAVVRYQDTRGRTWETRNQRHPEGELTIKRVRFRPNRW
jgi:hypothetical protein